MWRPPASQRSACIRFDDFTDPKHLPGIAFGHLLHGLIPNQPTHSDDPLFGCDPDLGRIDEWIFFQGEADRVGQLIIVIFFRGYLLQAVNNVASPGYPPGRTPAKRFCDRLGTSPLRRNCAVADCDNNRPGRSAYRFSNGCDIISDQAIRQRSSAGSSNRTLHT